MAQVKRLTPSLSTQIFCGHNSSAAPFHEPRSPDSELSHLPKVTKLPSGRATQSLTAPFLPEAGDLRHPLCGSQDHPVSRREEGGEGVCVCGGSLKDGAAPLGVADVKQGTVRVWSKPSPGCAPAHPMGVASGPKFWNSPLEGGPDFSAHTVSQVFYQQPRPQGPHPPRGCASKPFPWFATWAQLGGFI